MKKLLTVMITIAVIFFSACKSNKENPSDIFTKVYTTDNLSKEPFIIQADRDTILRGKSGTILRIYKNTFIDSKGQTIVGSIDIELKEAFTTYDMVIANLTTTTNGQMLQSGGMIYINASVDGQQVEIANDKFIGAIVPSENLQNDMQIFEGKLDSNGINWVNPKNTLNDELKAANVKVKSDSVAHVKQKKGKKALESILDYLASDTVEEGNNNDRIAPLAPAFEGAIFIQEFKQQKGTNFFVEDYQTHYIFTVKKLGWANIDRLYSDPRTKDVELITNIENHKDFQTVYVTMIISKMYLPGYQKQDETFSFTHGDYEKIKLPVGETATIMATAYKGFVPYFAIKKIAITPKQTVSFKLEETTMDKLKIELQKM
jgi:hypothetical protein